MAHAQAAKHVYHRNDGALFRKLPAEAKETLRYYELVTLMKHFEPLPPLTGHTLGHMGYYHVAVTDWSLFVVSRGSEATGVLLEIPLLSIKDLVRAGLGWGVREVGGVLWDDVHVDVRRGKAGEEG